MLVTLLLHLASTERQLVSCFSSEYRRGGALLQGNRHLSLSIDIFIGSTATGSGRTLVAKTSMNSRTRALSRVYSCGDPLKVIFDIRVYAQTFDVLRFA